jgi:menaquinone-dependent protoporphyrinogen IX oxidase
MKGIIVFDGKYGSTKQYASWIGEDLGFPVIDCRAGVPIDFTGYDTIIIGSSIMGWKLRAGKWIISHRNALKGKKVHLFTVSGTPPERSEALEKLARICIGQNTAREFRFYPFRGRMIYEKLPVLLRALLRVVSLFIRDPEARKGMTESFDHVKRENIAPLVSTVKGA